MIKIITCNYCGRSAQLVSGIVIYPSRPELQRRNYYLCGPCNAWVGCHKNTDIPFGRLANAELRGGRIRAHAAFDPIWGKSAKGGPKDMNSYSRSAAYRWLAAKLGIHPDRCHIGLFDVDQCERTIAMCGEFRAWIVDQADARERIRRMKTGRKHA